MFAFLTGVLEEKDNNIAVINCNGVGFEVNVSDTTIYELPNIGEMATIYTYMAVREDAITLFGFASREEKSAFLKLTSVSGIGGKMAIVILSAMPVADLIEAIVTENIRLLSSIKGLGKKTAERLVVELKNSFDDLQQIVRQLKKRLILLLQWDFRDLMQRRLSKMLLWLMILPKILLRKVLGIWINSF